VKILATSYMALGTDELLEAEARSGGARDSEDCMDESREVQVMIGRGIVYSLLEVI
jgi:hypothetical protein